MASIFKWAVGLTTAPRECSTLETSLKSLFRAGWTTPRLFAEPGTRIPQSACSLPLTQRDSCLGAFPNWYLALTELAMRHPDADARLLCQDDVLYIEGLRAYLNQHFGHRRKLVSSQSIAPAMNTDLAHRNTDASIRPGIPGEHWLMCFPASESVGF